MNILYNSNSNVTPDGLHNVNKNNLISSLQSHTRNSLNNYYKEQSSDNNKLAYSKQMYLCRVEIDTIHHRISFIENDFALFE